MVDDALPPCTPAREGDIEYDGTRAVVCRSGHWEYFVPGGPPERIQVLDEDGFDGDDHPRAGR